MFLRNFSLIMLFGFILNSSAIVDSTALAKNPADSIAIQPMIRNNLLIKVITKIDSAKIREQ